MNSAAPVTTPARAKALRVDIARHFDAAVARVESRSIRGWAEANRAAWISLLGSGTAVLAGRIVALSDSETLAGYIVATAIGA